ncbi:MAG: hypothetical protein ACLQVD_17485 [Capsulimonadaceae bacterium]
MRLNSGQEGPFGPAREWLNRVISGRRPATPVPTPEASASAADVQARLKHAARCYTNAALPADAARVYQRLGDHLNAAYALERDGRPRDAAVAFEQAGDWRQAARCHMEAGAPDRAANCFLRAGQPLHSAWVWVDRVGRPRAALSALAQAADPETAAAQLGAELVRARIEAETGARRGAARRLRGVADEMARTRTPFGDPPVYTWAIRVADALDRPDLRALVHASAIASGGAGARDLWERWPDGDWETLTSLDQQTGS